MLCKNFGIMESGNEKGCVECLLLNWFLKVLYINFSSKIRRLKRKQPRLALKLKFTCKCILTLTLKKIIIKIKNQCII